jgi:hypothetical protein
MTLSFQIETPALSAICVLILGNEKTNRNYPAEKTEEKAVAKSG